MSVRDAKMAADGYATWKCVDLGLGTTATGQTALETDSVIPGFDFEVERVSVYCTATAATISANVLIGSTSVLTGAITPVAGTDTPGTLSTTIANRRGSSTDAINLVYTSNGTGSATNGRVRVWIRPFPLNGEAMPLAGV